MIAYNKAAANKRGREFELSEEQIAQALSSVTPAAPITDSAIEETAYVVRSDRLTRRRNPAHARHINDVLSARRPRH